MRGSISNSTAAISAKPVGLCWGISLIIVALGFLRDAVSPIKESDLLPAIETFLEADLVLAFLVGVVLAFLMHSSVAAVLMIAVVSAAEAISQPVGIMLILGANLGGALVPVWITRAMPIEARRPVVANVALRGSPPRSSRPSMPINSSINGSICCPALFWCTSPLTYCCCCICHSHRGLAVR